MTQLKLFDFWLHAPSGIKKEWPRMIQAIARTLRPFRQSVGFDLPGQQCQSPFALRTSFWGANEGTSTSFVRVPLGPRSEKAWGRISSTPCHGHALTSRLCKKRSSCRPSSWVLRGWRIWEHWAFSYSCCVCLCQLQLSPEPCSQPPRYTQWIRQSSATKLWPLPQKANIECQELPIHELDLQLAHWKWLSRATLELTEWYSGWLVRHLSHMPCAFHTIKP